ncbi:MAG: DUF4340 domain-containing protein [Lachnospiraceae bacterium]|nr:DUF4340 domain-containing protein [Lachnospiraceae bacterium]
MKKQKVQLIVMLVLLVVAATAFVGIKSYNTNNEDKEAPDTESEYTVWDLNYDDVESFSFANEQGIYHFERIADGESKNAEDESAESEDSWSYIDDTSLNPDANKISSLLDNVLFIKAQSRIEDVSDWEQYGLADCDWEQSGFSGSDASVSITMKDGENYRLLFGDYNEITGKYYLSVAGEPYIYVLDSDIGAEFLITPDELTSDT